MFLDRLNFWRRRWKARQKAVLVKGLFLIIITFGIITTLHLVENQASTINGAREALQFILMSQGTPSSAFVLPDSDTLVHNPQSQCNAENGSKVFTLFIVVSAPANTAARDVIRSGFKFYLREYDNENRIHFEPTEKLNTLLFFTGLPQKQVEKRKLLNEASLHGDLIIDDFRDSYMNLTLKSLRLLKWIEQNCYNAEFAVKVDDDVHVNLRRLMRRLKRISTKGTGESMIGGQLRVNEEPVRDPSSDYGKWYTPLDLWPHPTFPNFVAGFFYIMGKEARSKVYKKALLKPLFHLEDVFVTGIVAEGVPEIKLANLSLTTDAWDSWKNGRTSSCDIQNLYMGIHFHMKLFNHLDCWKDFNDKDFVCSSLPLSTHCQL